MCCVFSAGGCMVGWVVYPRCFVFMEFRFVAVACRRVYDFLFLVWLDVSLFSSPSSWCIEGRKL